MNNYYVYEWIRLDTNEPFYVGKGHDDRCYDLRKRNKHFCDIKNYCETNGYGVAVSVLDEGLTSEEALATEIWFINHYTFEYGYNITNQTWGGDGGDVVSMMSPEQKLAYSEKMRQSCLGKNKGKKHTEESKRKMSESTKGMYAGEKNPMYGKNVKDFMTDEAIAQWKSNISKAGMGRTMSESNRAKIIEAQRMCVEGSLGEETFHFHSIKECKDYFADKYGVGHRLIQNVINSDKPYKGQYKRTQVLDGLILNKYKGDLIYELCKN